MRLCFVVLSLVLPAASAAQPAALPCLDADPTGAPRTHAVTFASGAITLAGTLYLPPGDGPHPAVLLLPGGGSNPELLRDTPHFFAKRFAPCRVAALTFDKRGTGDSGGEWASATFDDFIADAEHAVRFLADHPAIDAARIGLVGFSQGGRLAPVVAARRPAVAFVVSVSAPYVSVEATRRYALEQAFRRRGVQADVLDRVMPLWDAHLAAVAAGDDDALRALDPDLAALSPHVPRGVLPPPSTNRRRTPIYNSMGRDYARALADVRVPWFSLYGSEDAAVPVDASITVLRDRTTLDDEKLRVHVVPGASHSFVIEATGEGYRFERDVIAWVLALVDG